MANAVRPMIYVSILEFQAGSCPYVTAAVKAASHFGKAQGDHSGQSQFLGSLEPVGALVFQLIQLKILPPFGEACVCNPRNHRDPFGFVRFAFC